MGIDAIQGYRAFGKVLFVGYVCATVLIVKMDKGKAGELETTKMQWKQENELMKIVMWHQNSAGFH